MKLKKITATEVVVPAKPGTINSEGLGRPLHKLSSKGRAAWTQQFDTLPKLLLQLHWEDGLVGLGECYRDHDWETVETISDSLLGLELASLTLQELPISPCREYDGFECAVWDSTAKAHGLPLVTLLGGAVRERVLVGAWTGHREVAEIPELARRFAAQGYRHWKFKCDLEDDVAAWCAAIKEAAPGMKVVLDPNERWEFAFEARARLDELAKLGNVLCLEDPLPRWNLDAYRELRAHSSVAIALHVSLPYLAHGQRVSDAINALTQHAVDGFNFNGGLAKFAQLSSIAGAANLPFWHGSELDLGVLEAMYLHQCAAAKLCIWPSDIFGRLVRTHDLLETPLRLEPPYAYLPTGPGLGVELDPAALETYTTRQEVYA